MGKILSTIEFAKLFNYLDIVWKNKYGKDILSLYEDNPNISKEEITNYIMINISNFPDVVNIINQYGVYDIVYNFIYSMGNKNIVRISDETIENSRKKGFQLPIPTDEKQIERIFSGLRKNMELYERLYKDKVWIMESESLDGVPLRSAKLRMSPTKLFHLLGFDYGVDLNPNRLPENASIFTNAFRNSEYAMKLLSESTEKNYYLLLEELIASENTFMDSLLSGKVSNVVNVNKLEMKSYAFERIGALEDASGMIFFDKELAKEQGHERSTFHIPGDIILINDFIRKYDLDNLYGLHFVFMPFVKAPDNQKKDVGSLFVRSDSNSSLLLEQQKVSIMSKASQYESNDFNFTIRTSNGEALPSSDPKEVIEFDTEDKTRMASTIIKGLPSLSDVELKEIYDSIVINRRNK